MKRFFVLTTVMLAVSVFFVAMVSGQQPAKVKRPVSGMKQVGTTKSAKPDLVVSRINFSPGSPKENQEVTIWVFVKNNGSAPAEASGLRVAVGGEVLDAAAVIPVPALTPGREWRYAENLRGAGGRRSGAG